MLKIDLVERGSIAQVRKVLGELPYRLQTLLTYAPLKKGARIIVNQAKRSRTFKARRGSFGLAGTFTVVAKQRSRRVYANYGGKGNRHAHLIEFGTSERPDRGRVKPHRILEKAYRSTENEVLEVLSREIQHQLNTFADQVQAGKLSRGVQSVVRRAARSGG